MEAKLIKIDRNGSKHFEGMITCDRCGGSGVYIWMVCNGVPVPTIVDNGVCHKCFGAGKVKGKWIERTPEYQAKLDAKREARRRRRGQSGRLRRHSARQSARHARRLKELSRRRERRGSEQSARSASMSARLASA